MSLAEELECYHYHARVHDRAERLEYWVRKRDIIVVISTLRIGVDILRIMFILYIDISFSMIDFAQQSGRNRRGEKEVSLLILTSN